MAAKVYQWARKGSIKLPSGKRRTPNVGQDVTPLMKVIPPAILKFLLKEKRVIEVSEELTNVELGKLELAVEGASLVANDAKGAVGVAKAALKEADDEDKEKAEKALEEAKAILKKANKDLKTAKEALEGGK
jgi:hypothetical protein